MFLANWLRRRRPPNPIPAEVDKVKQQTAELRQLVAQLRQATPTKGPRP